MQIGPESDRFVSLHVILRMDCSLFLECFEVTQSHFLQPYDTVFVPGNFSVI